MTDHPYKCVRCDAAPLAERTDAFDCPGCGAAYPVVFGVPLFLPDVRMAPSGCELPPAVAAEVCRLHGFPTDPATVRTVQDILAQDYHLPDLSLAAENNYLLSRLPLADQPKRPPVTDNAAGLPVNREVRYRVTGHLIPDMMRAGVCVTRNVRLENTGRSVLSSKTADPIRLSYHWRSPTGQIVAFEGERTPLPVDLPPGRAITLPTLIRVPAEPGPYLLELLLVHEGVAWLDADAFHVGVDVVADAGPEVPTHWRVSPPSPDYTYAADHHLARERLVAEFQRRHRPGMRVLELGGCCAPLSRGLDAAVYSIDIDVQTLQVGQVSVTDPAERLHFVAADAHRLPFADRSFDAVVVVSALHHFSDPHRVLAGLKPLLNRGAFLAILCEPVGSYTDGRVSAEFVRELENGINEQIFTAAEYHRLFQRAGLYAVWVAVDGGSFKAILQAEPGPGL